MNKAPTKFLSLKQFMLRQEVLKLYREVIRTANKADKQNRKEIISWARSDIETHKLQTDEATIRNLLYNGKQMIKELQSTIKKTS